MSVPTGEPDDAGCDESAEAGTVEDAVMADPRALEMLLAGGGEVRTQVEGRRALAAPSDVVLLALDGHQRDAADGFEVDAAPAMDHLSFWEGMAHEHRVDRLQVELRRQVHDGQVLVVECAVLFRGVAVAAHEMKEEVLVSPGMAIEVHGHEPGQLKEARVDAAPE